MFSWSFGTQNKVTLDVKSKDCLKGLRINAEIGQQDGNNL